MISQYYFAVTEDEATRECYLSAKYGIIRNSDTMVGNTLWGYNNTNIRALSGNLNTLNSGFGQSPTHRRCFNYLFLIKAFACIHILLHIDYCSTNAERLFNLRYIGVHYPCFCCSIEHGFNAPLFVDDSRLMRCMIDIRGSSEIVRFIM